MARHFLTISDFTPDELVTVVERAIELKNRHKAGLRDEFMRGKTLGMIFTKSSTRTRTSFEAAVTQAGGNSLFLAPADSQLARGEPVEDTARVMSRMVDAIVIRTDKHAMIENFAAESLVPVINGLTDDFHPCQILADIQTWFEHRGNIQGQKISWIGDGCNVCHSWMKAAVAFDFTLVVATPKGYEPDEALAAACGDNVVLTNDPREAASGANGVITDTWAGMGQELEKETRINDFAGFQVDQTLMDAASSTAIFMHCLPAYRGVEVSAEVIDGPRSVVWDEAENRLHAQKALLEFLLA